MRHTAFVFDAYGTLFDVHSAVARLADRVGPDAPHLSELWRTKQLEYSWVRTLMSAYRDFWALTGDALDHALAKFPAVDSDLRPALLDAYLTLRPYPEVAATLQALKAGGARLGILSNGTPAMLDAAVASAGLDAMFDDLFSVEAVRAFKTAPAAYQLVLDNWRVAAHEVSFQSSNRWDIAGAARFGFHTVWVNRSGQPDEYGEIAADRVVKSLTELLTPA